MTEKRYVIEEIGNMFRVLKDNEPLTTKFENYDRQDVINLVEELNVLQEENEQSKMMIATLRNIVLEQEDLEKENQDNKAMIEFLSTENNQIMNELKIRTQIQHKLEEENEQLKEENKELLLFRNNYRKRRGI